MDTPNQQVVQQCTPHLQVALRRIKRILMPVCVNVHNELFILSRDNTVAPCFTADLSFLSQVTAASV